MWIAAISVCACTYKTLMSLSSSKAFVTVPTRTCSIFAYIVIASDLPPVGKVPQHLFSMLVTKLYTAWHQAITNLIMAILSFLMITDELFPTISSGHVSSPDFSFPTSSSSSPFLGLLEEGSSKPAMCSASPAGNPHVLRTELAQLG